MLRQIWCKIQEKLGGKRCGYYANVTFDKTIECLRCGRIIG